MTRGNDRRYFNANAAHAAQAGHPRLAVLIQAKAWMPGLHSP